MPVAEQIISPRVHPQQHSSHHGEVVEMFGVDGGSVRIDSAPAQGTTLTITLPVHG